MPVQRSYAPLDASELVDPDYLGTGSPDGTKVLYGDQTWGSPSGVTDIVDLPTAETDASLVLAPDGLGGVEFRAESSGGIPPTILDAKGDLISATADNTPAKLTAGADDTILMADSAAASGLKWAASATPSTQAFGDAAAAGTGDTYTRGDHKHAMPADPVTAHAAASDPHTGYQKESEKDAANGYLGLDAGTLVPTTKLGTGSGGGKFLKDDQTWGNPAGTGSVATDGIWDAAGDLAVGTGADTASKLTKGSDGQVLRVDPTTHLLTWYTPPTDLSGIDFLVGTASGDLSAEIVVGATPGGELGGTWASPTVDATHSGSAHHAAALNMDIGSLRSLFGVMSAGAAFTASRVYLARFTPMKDQTVTTAYWTCGTSAGNMDIGIYDAAQTTLLASTGSFGSLGTGNRNRVFQSSGSVAMTAGTTYYLAFVTDSTSLRIPVMTTVAINSNVNLWGTLSGSSIPLPSNASGGVFETAVVFPIFHFN